MIFTIKSSKDGTNYFCSSDGSVMLLPTFFSKSCTKNGLIWSKEKRIGSDRFISENTWVQREVQENTVNVVANRLVQFFNWLDANGDALMNLNNALDYHVAISDEWLNHYLNEYLIVEKKVSTIAIHQHLMALTHYYNYLAHAKLSHVRTLRIVKTCRNLSRENTKKKNIIRYLTVSLRNELYKEAKKNSLRDECILRAGGQLGLRSKELAGLVLEDYNNAKGRFKGLKSLFNDMEVNRRSDYKFWLQGRFVKKARGGIGGMGRYLYISHALLGRFKEYYTCERPSSKSNSLFVNNCQNPEFLTESVPTDCGTSTFRKIRRLVLRKQKSGLLDPDEQLLEDEHSFHMLRHSFGTDKFYEAAHGNMDVISSVTMTHPVYLYVAELLGHSSSESTREASQTTKRYIHSCGYRFKFLAN